MANDILLFPVNDFSMDSKVVETRNGTVRVDYRMDDIKFYDFWRLYYTAFSRAQNLLVLAAGKADSKYFGEYLRELPDIQTFESAVAFAPVKPVNYKRV